MTNKGKPRRCLALILFLSLSLLSNSAVYPTFANDRSSDIIGSRPLMARDIITPSGLTGRGQIVGIADSGLDAGSMSDIHPDLADPGGAIGIPKVMLQSYTNRSVADDPDGHGTFMAATIAGTGAASDGKYRGIAPGASLYFQALLDKNNEIKAPQDIADLFLPAYQAGVRVHVNGWGNGSNSYSDSATQIDKFTYTYPEFLPIFSAGNGGPGRGTITSQANSKNALVIGSSQVPRPAFDTEARYADQVAASSGRGPTRDGRIKPDLLAPGSALISACSRLTESNFVANPNYTQMGGSSMAAAVTGGAVALLREQLSLQYGLNNPSSALLKAFLINGARSRSGDLYQEGFGILDLAGTSLAIKEGKMKFADSKTRLRQGQSSEYKLQVDDPTMPIRITLAWIDPAGNNNAAGSLINDLDLYVIDANGHRYYGNDVDNRGVADSTNNVERVSINVPSQGEYTIVVKASRVSPGIGPVFSLVYGQLFHTGIISEINGSQVKLAEGTTLNMTGAVVKQILDGAAPKQGESIPEGSDIYYNDGKAFIFAKSWQSGGIQATETEEGDLVVEMNKNVREGGYYVDPRVTGKDGRITLNGRMITRLDEIPPGAEIKATVNPVLQTLWNMEVYQDEVNGYVESVDPANRQLRLINNGKVYRLARWAAISYRDRIVDVTVQDAPYSTADRSIFENLLPGTQVTMKVSPGTGLVQSLFVERPLVIGRVTGVDAVNQKVTLDTGKTYSVFPGTIVNRNREQAAFDDIQVGDRLKAQLMINSSTVIHMDAYSEVNYGRIVYTNAKKKSLYMIDSQNRSHSYTIGGETEIFGMDIAVESSALSSGDWVRIIGDPDNQEAWRIDIADIQGEAIKTLLSVDYAGKRLIMSDGTAYHYEKFTRITVGGYSMEISDLHHGQNLQLTTLLAPSPWMTILAGIEASTPTGAPLPNINITARSLNGVLIIQGYTDADRLYIYRNDGNRETIDTKAGNFNRIFNLLEKETEITAVAVDMQSGAIRDVNVKIGNYPIGSPIPIFNDISSHWAEEFIVKLAGRGAIKGYEDGTFRPDKTINRAELMVMISQSQHLSGEKDARDENFIDALDIPWWAMTQVQAARENDWITGYPDGSFRPYAPVTRRQLAEIFANMQNTNLTSIFPGESLQPGRLVTRAEVAAVLARL